MSMESLSFRPKRAPPNSAASSPLSVPSLCPLSLDDKLHLADDIQLIGDGLPAGLEDDLLDAAEDAFESMPRPRRKDDAVVAETIRIAVRRAADQIWGKKPVCKVLVQRA